MATKKSFWENLFGGMSGRCSCGMEVAEEIPKKKGVCCDVEILEEDPKKKDDCCGPQKRTGTSQTEP